MMNKRGATVTPDRHVRGVVGRFFGNILLSFLALAGVVTLCVVLLVAYFFAQNIDTSLDEDVLAQQSYVGASQLYYYDYTAYTLMCQASRRTET